MSDYQYRIDNIINHMKNNKKFYILNKSRALALGGCEEGIKDFQQVAQLNGFKKKSVTINDVIDRMNNKIKWGSHQDWMFVWFCLIELYLKFNDMNTSYDAYRFLWRRTDWKKWMKKQCSMCKRDVSKWDLYECGKCKKKFAPCCLDKLDVSYCKECAVLVREQERLNKK